MMRAQQEHSREVSADRALDPSDSDINRGHIKETPRVPIRPGISRSE